MVVGELARVQLEKRVLLVLERGYELLLVLEPELELLTLCKTLDHLDPEVPVDFDLVLQLRVLSLVSLHKRYLLLALPESDELQFLLMHLLRFVQPVGRLLEGYQRRVHRIQPRLHCRVVLYH